jgi:hypothetical protein
VKQALPLDSADVLTAGQIEQWHTKGWLVLDNIWPSDAIAAAAAAAAEITQSPPPVSIRPKEVRHCRFFVSQLFI